MIKRVIITNHLDESIEMNLRNPESSGFLIYDVSGLGPPKAVVNTTSLVTIDGSIFNSVWADKRNVVFELKFVHPNNIETVRHKTYKYFPIKRKVKITVETDERTCEVYGYVESNEPTIFSDSEGSVISIICPDSYLYSTEKSVTFFSNLISLFEFPFSNESLTEKLIIFGEMSVDSAKVIQYTGESPIGILIYIHVNSPVSNINIVNLNSNEYMKLESDKLILLTGFDFLSGDDIVISTVKGNKYAILQRGGETINILNIVKLGSTWFQIEEEETAFLYQVDDDLVQNLHFRIENRIAYEGI